MATAASTFPGAIGCAQAAALVADDSVHASRVRMLRFERRFECRGKDDEDEAAAQLLHSVQSLRTWIEIEKARIIGTGLDASPEDGGEQSQSQDG